MYAKFSPKSISDSHEVTDALDQMQHLLNRFHCTPLIPFPTFEGEIINWLRTVDQPASADIKAIYIGIFETDDSRYALHLSGARNYDENDEDWACDEDFVPERQYVRLNTEGIENIDWEDILQIVIDVVSQYLKTNENDSSSLFYGKIVAVGFDEGNLTRIQ